MLHKIATTLKLFGAHAMHLISFCSPRKKNIAVFIGWHNGKDREIFADNAKYLFLHFQNEHPEFRSVWLAKDTKLASLLKQKGYLAYYQHSLLGIYYALRAGYTIVDAHFHTCNWKFSGRSKVMQLWHGKGMKKSGHVSNRKKRNSYFINPAYHSNYNSIIATSNKTADLLTTTFNQPISDIIVTGHPRTDILHKNIPGAEIDAHHEFEKQIQLAKENGAKKIILYAPTFRPDGSNPLATFDIDAANNHMEKLNYHMFVSLHPKFSAKDSGICEKNSHLTYIAAGYDIYPQLKQVDMLITDYSSLYVDFLMLDRPIIFYTYDLDKYKKESGLYDDFETLTPGPHPQNFTDLLEAIESEDTYKENRNEVRDVLFSHNDGSSAKRISEQTMDTKNC